MNGAAVNNRYSCNDGTLPIDSGPTAGPRPCTAPQIARKATAIMMLLTPVDPKRNADHSKNGTIVNAGARIVDGDTKLKYPRTVNPASSAHAST